MNPVSRRTLLAAIGAAGMALVNGDQPMSPQLPGDSIQPLLAWRPGDPGARPGFGGRGEDLRYMQGTVVAWDPATAQNVVRIRGTDHTNVPLIGGLDGLVMRPRDQVAILAWSPNGGTAAYFIIGRLVVPGSPAAERSIEALQTDLARGIIDNIVEQLIGSAAGSQLIRGLIGQATEEDFIASQVDTSSTSWQDLGGPSVTVDIGPSGRAKVEWGAVMTTTPGEHASMSFQVSGATSQPPHGERSVQQQTDSGSAVVVTQSAQTRVTGLNEGTHTFAARYTTFTSTGSGFWSNRYLIVTPY